MNRNRRLGGVGALKKRQEDAKRYKDKAAELSEGQFQDLTRQFETFKTNLAEFAENHQQEIKKDPKFRKHFQEMCASLGVDPLASSKGFWSGMLGLGDFYYEIGVQIVEICMATSHRTGGLMELGEIRHRLIKSRGKSRSNDDISTDDVLRAIKKLKVLGNGFAIIPLDSGRFLIQSVPGELSMDTTAILQKCETNSGVISISVLTDELGWDRERSERALDNLVKEGLAWVDKKGPDEVLYWVPSIFSSL